MQVQQTIEYIQSHVTDGELRCRENGLSLDCQEVLFIMTPREKVLERLGGHLCFPSGLAHILNKSSSFFFWCFFLFVF